MTETEKKIAEALYNGKTVTLKVTDRRKMELKLKALSVKMRNPLRVEWGTDSVKISI